MNEVTRILGAIERGEPQAADRLLPLVYDELRQLAAQHLAREAPGHTLQPTALVHEAYLRLLAPVADARGSAGFAGRGHFFAAAAEAMRRILIDTARRKHRLKRGGGRERIDLDRLELAAPAADDNLLALDEALTKLAEAEPAVAELVKLRYFAGLTIEQTAAALGVSVRTANRHWAYARAWLYQRLSEQGRPGE